MWYIKNKKSTHSNVDAPNGFQLSLRTPPILWSRQDRQFLFTILFFIEKGKQSNNQVAKG